ncbi:MAG: hypothetical protein M3388_15520 [Acidobacteriota bacterium]|nr:hypothetical protein [Acidobacteriota bacterium]
MQKFSSSIITRRKFFAGWLLSVAFCAGIFMTGATNIVSAQSLVVAKEKKEIDKQIPAYKKEIVEKCGDFKFEIEVDYNSFAEKADVLSLVPTQGIKQAVNALRRICTDSTNTSAQDETAAGTVSKRIKRIVFVHIPDPKKKNIELTKDGILYVRNSYGTPSGIIPYVEMTRDLTKVL